MAAAAAATGYSVSLGASLTALAPGSGSTLTAHSSVDVGPTIYYIEIFDVSVGQLVALCGAGTTCSGSVSQASPTTHAFTAYISSDGGSWPPSGVQATSNTVNVTWLSITLSASARYLGINNIARLTATANADVGPTPWLIEIFDQTTGQFLADCATGSSCSVSVTRSSPFAEAYSAYVSGYGTGNPPPSVQAHLSTFTLIDWLAVYLYPVTGEGTVLYPNSSVTINGVASEDIGPTPYWITVYDISSGANVASCPSGYSCSVSIKQGSATARTYVAYLSFTSSTNPPPNITATSNATTVTWALYTPYGNPSYAWFAGKAPDYSQPTDPINFVIYKPDGNAAETFVSYIASLSAEPWYWNTCYDTSVKFYAGTTSSAPFRSPDASYATDVTNDSPPPTYSGCGSTAHERNHLRYWQSSDDTAVWVAVSYEYRGDCTIPGILTHCVSPNGFNRGRDDLNADLRYVVSNFGFRYDEKYLQPYSAGVISGSGGNPTIPYDGQVDVFTILPSVWNSPSSMHASWVSDSYNGAPLTAISLQSGHVSSNIYVTFDNQGPGSWDSNTVLAYWYGGTDDGQPGDGTAWCHSPVVNGGNDWLTCNPGVPAWIGSGRTIQPGQNGTFEFQIQAPQATTTISTTLYFRPAQRLSNGTYAWINTAAGNRTYDYFTVNVTPAV